MWVLCQGVVSQHSKFQAMNFHILVSWPCSKQTMSEAGVHPGMEQLVHVITSWLAPGGTANLFSFSVFTLCC